MQTLNVDVGTIKPIITSISPTTVGAGSDAFELTILGSNFVAGAQVFLVADSLPITFFSSTEIHVTVPALDIRTAGALVVNVTNPGNLSADNPPSLTVTAPVYLIQNIAPTEIFQGGPTVDVVIFGDNIPTDKSIVVTMNGAALPTGVSVKSTNTG